MISHHRGRSFNRAFFFFILSLQIISCCHYGVLRSDILERQCYDRINKLVIKARSVIELSLDKLEVAPEWTEPAVVSWWSCITLSFNLLTVIKLCFVFKNLVLRQVEESDLGHLYCQKQQSGEPRLRNNIHSIADFAHMSLVFCTTVHMTFLMTSILFTCAVTRLHQ